MSTKKVDKRTDYSRPFKCTHAGCKWAFARQEHMTRHLRTHSGDRPFTCHYPKCPSRFARNDELRRHIRLIHEYDRDTSHEPALTDADKVVYNGPSHNRRQSEQVTSTVVAGSSSGAGMSWNAEASGQASSSRMQLPPRPATSMNYYQSTSFAMPPPPLPSSSSRRTFAEPSPHYPPSGQPPASFMPPPPASYGMPPPQQYQHPQQYQQPPNYPQAPSSSTYQYMPTAAGRSFTPVHLPPLQQYDGYVTESGTSRRERRVQLPGFSEIARQNQQPSDPNRRHYQ